MSDVIQVLPPVVATAPRMALRIVDAAPPSGVPLELGGHVVDATTGLAYTGIVPGTEEWIDYLYVGASANAATQNAGSYIATKDGGGLPNLYSHEVQAGDPTLHIYTVLQFYFSDLTPWVIKSGELIILDSLGVGTIIHLTKDLVITPALADGQWTFYADTAGYLYPCSRSRDSGYADLAQQTWAQALALGAW